MSDPTSRTPPTATGDDPFFVIRDCRELFLKRLAGLARQAGVSSSAVVDAFLEAVGEAHDELVSASRTDSFDQTRGLTASRISLVGNDDLEIDIRVGEIATRLKENKQIDHWRVQLRYKTLLRRPTMTAEQNPVGITPIGRGLWAVCRASSGTLEQNFERLERLEETLHRDLPEIYIELNKQLEQRRVEAAPDKVIQRIGSDSRGDDDNGGNRDRGPGGPGGGRSEGGDGSTYRSGPGGNGWRGDGGLAGGDASAAIEQILLRLVAAAEQMPAGYVPTGGVPLTPGMVPGMVPAMPAGMVPGMVAGVAPGLAPGVVPGMVPGLVPAMPAGMVPGMVPAMPASMVAGGIAAGVPVGLAAAGTVAADGVAAAAYPAGTVALGTPLVFANQWVAQLSALEAQAASQSTDGAAPPTPSLRAKDIDLPPGQPASVALDTLALIFDAIAETPDLPQVAKTAVARLQIPLFRVAVIDPAFFANADHPARRLINRMARATLGLAPDGGQESPLATRLGEIADSARKLLGTRDEISSDLLDAQFEQIEALIAERDQGVIEQAAPYVRLVVEHEETVAACAAADAWLQKLWEPAGHPVIRDFLAHLWHRVMQAVYRAGGIDGEAWGRQSAVIDDLFWSVRTKATAEERNQALTQIPGLLRRINHGLDLADVPSGERQRYLDTFFELQTAALRNRPELAGGAFEPRPAGSPAPVSVPEAQGETILERQGRLVHYLGSPRSPEATDVLVEAGLAPGTWAALTSPEGEPLTGLCCWQSEACGTHLFFNPDWGFAVALAPSLIERQLADGSARILDSAALFDEATQRALARLAPT